MASIEYDIHFLREALVSLEGYLLAEDLYWNLSANPPPGEPAYPALSLGGVLLAEARLRACHLDPSTYAQFKPLANQIEAIHSRWRTAWEKKGRRSFKSRLTQWANFLEEYRSQPDAHHDRYAYEVRLRLMLDLLAVDLPEIPSEQEQLLIRLDRILKNYLAGDEFVWEEAYKDGFPRQQYWYLYGRLSLA